MDHLTQQPSAMTGLRGMAESYSPNGSYTSSIATVAASVVTRVKSKGRSSDRP